MSLLTLALETGLPICRGAEVLTVEGVGIVVVSFGEYLRVFLASGSKRLYLPEEVEFTGRRFGPDDLAILGFKQRGRRALLKELREAVVEMEEPEEELDPLPLRPITRAGCQGRPGICPWFSCRYNLCFEMTEPSVEAWEKRPTCVLDVADEGEHSLAEIAEIFGVSRERVRQIEVEAMAKLKKRFPWFEKLL
ncbi:MAG: hypothetical protein KKD44_28635 [Proteobacteria bacterium]|nr:hypothetical protein [Pseudomonadota bacterium]